MRRHLPLFLVLFAVYAATLGVDAVGGATPSKTSDPEAHTLLTVESLVDDGDLDLRNQYRDRAWTGFYAGELKPNAIPLPDGRLHEPSGVAFPLLLAPAYAVAGLTGARLLLAAIAALTFCLAAALGRRLVPDPWPGRAALVAGLSAPAVGAATAVGPEMPAAALTAGAAIFALRVRESPQSRPTAGTAALAAVLPWLAAKLLVPAIVLAAALYRWLRRRRRGLQGFIALEVVLTSAVVYVTANGQLFGGVTPNDAALQEGGVTGATSATDYLDRLPRVLGLWVDRDAGLLRWAPVFALAGVGLWLLWRSQRDRLAMVVSDQVDVEVTAQFYALLAAALFASAVVLAPEDLGPWFAGHELVVALPPLTALAAWGWRFAPRLGTALAVLTVAASAWVLIAGWGSADAGLRPPTGPLPWGGLQDLLPPVRG
ncbi:hypothetical protein [Conexibacter sp. SYSU D00693]|uniref:hypothetical protein n=1 Tax=Conexibacter sp. SYSU D00693 TaxID=2812560 RepID=UPI00196A27BD|nr:hypothetical protein [Conexibacter sp. SYSU D00693]